MSRYYDPDYEQVSDRELAYEAGYDPTPEEAAVDARARMERAKAARAKSARRRRTMSPLPKGGPDPWASS